MSIDLLLYDVLHKIKSGTASFDPDSHSGGDLKKFQTMAKAIVHARDRGYIEKISSSKESISGQLYYNAVVVISGLTYAGERLLQEISGKPTPADEALGDLLNRVTSHNIREKWDKALHRRVTDPSGAITAARSLLETTLKWIVEQCDGEITDNNQELFKRVIVALGIDAKGKPIEKLIEGLNLVVWGIGGMRNKHGDAHGTLSNSLALDAHAAGFCVNLAAAAALYLLEEYEASQKYASKFNVRG